MERGASQYMYGIMDMDKKTKLIFFFPLVDCVGCLGHRDHRFDHHW
jgi:hypothetical protein